jgi:ATPase family associated with various cellular activities (AAA)
METKLMEDFRSASRANVPLVVIQTSEPAAVMSQILELTTKPKITCSDAPVIRWDVSSGLIGMNTPGKNALNDIVAKLAKKGSEVKLEEITDPAATLRLMKDLPAKSILFILNGHRFIGAKDLAEAVVGQAIWNLRDEFKRNFRMLVMLSPDVQLPPELKNDVIVLDDPLPTPAELKELLGKLYEAAHAQNSSFPEEPGKEMAEKGAEAVRGLSMFAAEQSYAMSLTKTGLDLDKLWKMKRKTIENVPGLRLWTGTETFDDVRGVENMKEYLTLVMEGEDRPTVLVFWDEMEKAFAGSRGGDLSGVSQEMHGMTLSWMSDENVPAIRMMGIQGCSKSYIVKATAGQFKKPLIIMNLSELKGGIVGQSTQQLREAFRTISAIGRPLVLATCNDEEALSPELRDRFSLGVFFFDLFTKSERKAVWNLYIKKFDLKSNPPKDDEGWTPRNIKDCCSLAWRLRCTLVEASKYIVPVLRSAPERVEELRKMANGKYLSAAHPGVYKYVEEVEVVDDIRGIDTSEVGNA